EEELRARLAKAKTAAAEAQRGDDEAANLRSQLDDANAALATLQRQMAERDARLAKTLARESELRARLKTARLEAADETTMRGQALEGREKTHAAELRGLVKQIQYLRARCGREEGFRADLAYAKRWFLMQVEMYNACNAADLNLLADTGIRPPPLAAIRESRPTLRAVGWMVIASVRMKRLQTEWAGNKKLHESLIRKLEMTRRGSKGGRRLLER
ncbi:hypothetical protein B0A49_04943, partial [Cryomyces minteri]